MVELTNNEDNLAFLIAKANEFDTEVEAVDEDSGSNASDDGEVDVLNFRKGNSAPSELARFLHERNIDEKMELLALMWLGRGDYSAAEWDDALDAATDFDSRKISRYLLGQPTLGDFIASGLEELGIDIDPYEND